MVHSAPEPPRPYHVEAYPRLNLLEAVRQLRRGVDHLLWRDEEDVVVGLARLSTLVEGQLGVQTWFRARAHLSHGTSVATIGYEQHRDANGCEQALTVCPDCGTRRRYLVSADGRWRCRSCLRLTYRSSIMGARLRESEQLDQLGQAIGAGRPAYMRSDQYRELRLEHFWLGQEHGEEPAVAKPHQRARLTSSWLAVPATPDLSFSQTSTASPDLLELSGKPLFSDQPVEQRVTSTIQNAVGPVYRAVRTAGLLASQLRVRRAMPSIDPGSLPVLGKPQGPWIIDPDADPLAAWLVVPFTGTAALFKAGLTPPAGERPPIAIIEDERLVITARFDHANLPFVPALLHAELLRVRASLARQEQCLTRLARDLPGLIKRSVAQHWPALTARRHN